MPYPSNERLERLERKIDSTKRRYRRLLLAVAGAATLGIMVTVLAVTPSAPAQQQGGQESFETVQANQFELVDAEGETRALMLVTNDGPTFALGDRSGTLRLIISLDQGRPLISLRNSKGTDRVKIGVVREGPALELYDRLEEGRATLTLRDGKPRLALFDETGTTRAVLGATTIRSPDGRVTNYPESYLQLANESGNVIWSAPR